MNTTWFGNTSDRTAGPNLRKSPPYKVRGKGKSQEVLIWFQCAKVHFTSHYIHRKCGESCTSAAVKADAEKQHWWKQFKKKRPPHLQSFTTVPFHVYSLTQNLRLKKCKYFRLLGNETKTKKKSVCMCIYLQMIQYFTGTKQFKREELDKIARKILGTRIVWGFTFDKSWSFKKQLHRISQTWIRWA